MKRYPASISRASAPVPSQEGMLLLGGGGHCRAVIDVLELAGKTIAGVVHGPDAPLSDVLGYPPLGRDRDLAELRRLFPYAMVTVGQIKTADVRRMLFHTLLRHDFSLPAVISPLARLSPHASVKAGTIVMHHALINAGAHVGLNCIINSKALIEHECHIGDHCHVAVGAVLCGGVSVEEGTCIGAGALVRENTHIGSNCIIGMGARILHDVPNNSIIYT